MIDLNHGSGCQYEGAEPRTAGHRRSPINAAIDAALRRTAIARSRRGTMSARPGSAAMPAPDPVRLPRRPERRGPRVRAETLRIFEAGHRGEDIVAAWLRARRLRPAHRTLGRPAVRILRARWPLQGPHRRLPGRRAGAASHIPRSGRTRRSAPRPGRRSSRTASCSRSRSTRRRSRSIRPISICRIRRCSPRSTATPWSSTASSCRSTPRSRRRMSDRAVAGGARQRSARNCCRALPPTGPRPLPRWPDRRRMARRLRLAGSLLEARRHDRHHPIRHPGRAPSRAIKDWFKNRTDEQQVFRLFGYAGTGKVHRPEIRARRAWARSAQERAATVAMRAGRRHRHLHRQGGAGAPPQGHAGAHHPQPDLQRASSRPTRRSRPPARRSRRRETRQPHARRLRSHRRRGRRSRPCARRCRR